MSDETPAQFTFENYFQRITQRETDYWDIQDRSATLAIAALNIQRLAGLEIKQVTLPDGRSLEERLREENQAASISIHKQRDEGIEELRIAIENGLVTKDAIERFPGNESNRYVINELQKAVALQDRLDAFVQSCVDYGILEQSDVATMKETYDRSHVYHKAINMFETNVNDRSTGDDNKNVLNEKLVKSLRDNVTLYVTARDKSRPGANVKIQPELFGYDSLDNNTIPNEITDPNEALWYLANIATYFNPKANPYRRLYDLFKEINVSPESIVFEINSGETTSKQSFYTLLGETTTTAYAYARKLFEVIEESPVKETLQNWFGFDIADRFNGGHIEEMERDFFEGISDAIGQTKMTIKTPQFVIDRDNALHGGKDGDYDNAATQPMFPGVVREQPPDNPNKTVSLN